MHNRINPVRTAGTLVLAVAMVANAKAQDARPYRLGSTDLKQRVIWGAQSRQPDGAGLAFGGQDQDADDGRPHTRLWTEGKWQSIHRELREKNPLQQSYEAIWKLRGQTKRILAQARFIYFKGLPADEETALLRERVDAPLATLRESLQAQLKALAAVQRGPYEQRQGALASEGIQNALERLQPVGTWIEAKQIQAMHEAQIELEIAAERLDAEPPARAMDCGPPRKQGEDASPAQVLVYDATTKLYVLFGGDHLDYLTNDTWVFDPAQHKWRQCHPDGAPPPRANHHLEALGDGRIKLTGGYTYSSNTDYVGGQYLDRNDGAWFYDIQQDAWTGGKLVRADRRVYRSGPFHPDYYLQGDKPDAKAFAARLESLPANQWVATDPPYRPRLNRDWGCARLDPDRDMLLRWSGGHSAHGGTDVPHFHFSTNRWELPMPVEFPLGQLYSNTSYPNGFNFNRRPWITGHTYQNYAYDLLSKRMIKAGRPRHYYVYDPDLGDWVGRGPKPAAMQYNSCFYTLTLTSTPHGIVCWDRNGRVHLFDAKHGLWNELELTGDKLPGAYVDNSTIAYDSQRDRVLIVNTGGYRVAYDGQIYALDMKTRAVKQLSPAGSKSAQKLAYVDRCCYHAKADLLIMASFLKDSGDHTPTPAYDCADNRWVALDLAYETGKRGDRTTRAFPHGRSCGLIYDPRRNLLWGTDTNSQIYVLRLELSPGELKPFD